MIESPLDQPLSTIKGIGPKTSQLLMRWGLRTFEDALYYLPRDYEDRSKITKIGDLLPSGGRVTVVAKVMELREFGRGPARRAKAWVGDGTGRLELVWFRCPPGLAQQFPRDSWFLFYGEIQMFGGGPSMAHPEYEKVDGNSLQGIKPSRNFGRIVPIYTETEGLNSKALRKILLEVIDRALPHIVDPLPPKLLRHLCLPDLKESFRQVHFPKAKIENETALKRIIFEEFFILQMALALRRREREKILGISLKLDEKTLSQFVSGLPFSLTGDQTRAIEDLQKDVARSFPMTRLLQGDVGAGKTVVAFAGILAAFSEGRQAALLAPTEILAEQHFTSARKVLTSLGLRVAMLSQSTEDRPALLEKMRRGEVDLVIGTHALFQPDIEFKSLSVVVIDEQHRFGVEQRGKLLSKGKKITPHLLLMSATPIPRTLALTLYGDLELSLLREKPPGRQRIITKVMREQDRPRLYQRIREVVAAGGQVYLIYPLVDVSEKLDLKSATEMYQSLSREIFPDLKVGLVHGKLDAVEKNHVLDLFRKNEVQILVSTTVVEVGIDVPNATLMVVEHPERLGLSQLHQLRGRVGRGMGESQCILMSSQNIGRRLRVMEASDDGFEIAEEDLKIRGPGEFLGVQQSGLPGFRVGHLLRDSEWLDLARLEAQRLLDDDPDLIAPENAGIRETVESRWKKRMSRLRGG